MTTPLHTYTSGTAMIGPNDVPVLRLFAARLAKRANTRYPVAVIHAAFERVLREELKAIEDELFAAEEEPTPIHHPKEHRHE